jgi:hypothetical protein
MAVSFDSLPELAAVLVTLVPDIEVNVRNDRLFIEPKGTQAQIDATIAMAIANAPPDEVRLKDMTCPQCRQAFVLGRDADTLQLRGCPSGGIYDVRISCPHCDYEEEL